MQAAEKLTNHGLEIQENLIWVTRTNAHSNIYTVMDNKSRAQKSTIKKETHLKVLPS